jgi:caa(3)-type oxidase subunit IV
MSDASEIMETPDMEREIPSVTRHDDHAHSDTVQVPFIGSVTAPGGIYTVVFGALGALTILEVIIAEVTKGADGTVLTVRSILLFTLSVIKALLVVWFYMHLKIDNPIFRWILALPVLIVVLSIVYLVGVPIAGGGGYR